MKTDNNSQALTGTTGDVDRVTMFGLPVTNTRMSSAVRWIVERAGGDEKSTLNFVNAHCLNMAATNIAYQRVLRQSDRLYPDGSGVALAMRLRGKRMRDNLNGTDLLPHLCRSASAEGLSLFLLGGHPGVADEAAANLRKQYPDLRIAGTQHGYFDEADTDRIIDTVNGSGADILLVAMGVPQQELWIAAHRGKLECGVAMGVGGLFDFFSQRIPRAPLWLRKLGCEWVWRLLQEPARMWKRYLVGNPVFVLRAMREALAEKRSRGAAERIARGRLPSAARRLRWALQGRITPVLKRSLDIGVAGAALLAASPVFMLTALAIRLNSPGPVFFSQQRVGYRGREFRFWKFRSMYTDAEARKTELQAMNEMDGGVLFKMKEDPRITPVGRFIRRFSIDELPQLWNVLRGDMALVGPRPALPAEVEQYSIAQRQRLMARPGITCIWQISGRSNIPFDQQVEMDKEYIHKSTLGTDVKILIKTVPAVLGGDGAY